MSKTQDTASNSVEHEPGTIAYELEGSLYLNLTNRCTADCTFCSRSTAPLIGPYNLRLRREPTLRQLRTAVGDPSRYKEIVFCGYGEPTLRLGILLQLSGELRQHQARTRLNTNGHGNLIHRRDIVPELAPWIDAVSVSLNAPDAESYLKLCRPRFGLKTFDAIVAFTRRCRELIGQVAITVVDTGTVDLEACSRVADTMGVPLHVRRYYDHIAATNRILE